MSAARCITPFSRANCVLRGRAAKGLVVRPSARSSAWQPRPEGNQALAQLELGGVGGDIKKEN